MTLDNDTYDVQVRWVFLQRQPEETAKPIVNLSKPLKDTERKTDRTQRECLTVELSVLLFQSYLDERRFTIHSDNDS